MEFAMAYEISLWKKHEKKFTGPAPPTIFDPIPPADNKLTVPKLE